MATHSSVLAWRIPGRTWWAAVSRVTQSQTRLKRLSNSREITGNCSPIKLFICINFLKKRNRICFRSLGSHLFNKKCAESQLQAGYMGDSAKSEIQVGLEELTFHKGKENIWQYTRIQSIKWLSRAKEEMKGSGIQRTLFIHY